MSGRFVSGGVHWRINGGSSDAIARLRSEGLKLLGTLRDTLGSTPSGVIQRTYPDGIVRAEYAMSIPIVTITAHGAGGDTEDEAAPFMDSGLFTPESREVRRQTLQIQAQAAQRSWLGHLIFKLREDGFSFVFDKKNRNGTTRMDQVAALLPLIRVSGRARLLRQALVGRMDAAGAAGLQIMAGFPSFGLLLISGRYYCLTADGSSVYIATLLFRTPATRISDIRLLDGEADKREAYLLSLADLSTLKWRKIGSLRVIGEPLAYGWNWHWTAAAATMTTHVIVDGGASASFTARLYHLSIRTDDSGVPVSAVDSLIDTTQWYPRRQTTNVWYPKGLGVVCVTPPLASSSYPDGIAYDAPIYSFYRRNGDHCVVRLSHSTAVRPGKNEFGNNQTICGLGSSGWLYTYSDYVEHTYSATTTAAEVTAVGFDYSAIGANTDRIYAGSTSEIATFARADAVANDCPPGAADDIPDYGSALIQTDVSMFIVTETNDATFSTIPKIAIVISPFDCEAVTLMASETFTYRRTEVAIAEVGTNPYEYHFPAHSVTVERSPHQQFHDYTTISSNLLTDSSAAYRGCVVGVHHEYSETAATAGETGVLLGPSIDQMVTPQNSPLFRQGAVACDFIQKPSDRSQYWRANMTDAALVQHQFAGWA